MRTTAEEKLESANQHIHDAVQDLFVVANPDTWSEYNENFKLKVLEAITMLIKLQKH